MEVICPLSDLCATGVENCPRHKVPYSDNSIPQIISYCGKFVEKERRKNNGWKE